MSRVSEFVLKQPSATIVQRSWTSSVGNTVTSAKHWNTCMANKPCKIIAIIFIVIGGILVFWLLGSIFSCLRTGCEGWVSFFCWPCEASRNSRSQQQPATQYIVPQQQQWNSNSGGQGNYYTNDRDRNDYGRVFEEDLELETQDFDLEAQKQKSSKKQSQAAVDNSDNSSWFNYNPFASKNDPPAAHNTTTYNEAQPSTYEEYNPFSKFSQNSNKH